MLPFQPLRYHRILQQKNYGHWQTVPQRGLIQAKSDKILQKIRLAHPNAACVPCVFGKGGKTFFEVTTPATASSPEKKIVVDKNDKQVIVEAEQKKAGQKKIYAGALIETGTNLRKAQARVCGAKSRFLR